MIDGPNDEGIMFKHSNECSDFFPEPCHNNDDAAKPTNNGTTPYFTCNAPAYG